jgi:hypothetical protein
MSLCRIYTRYPFVVILLVSRFNGILTKNSDGLTPISLSPLVLSPTITTKYQFNGTVASIHQLITPVQPIVSQAIPGNCAASSLSSRLHIDLTDQGTSVASCHRSSTVRQIHRMCVHSPCYMPSSRRHTLVNHPWQQRCSPPATASAPTAVTEHER